MLCCYLCKSTEQQSIFPPTKQYECLKHGKERVTSESMECDSDKYTFNHDINERTYIIDVYPRRNITEIHRLYKGRFYEFEHITSIDEVKITPENANTKLPLYLTFL